VRETLRGQRKLLLKEKQNQLMASLANDQAMVAEAGSP